ncbi:MAG TPA: PVC-type heme-binding CxxCH protein [Luteitalea sp.]|nr:PVC-type heme-binding CxxCH protein [Luteitalea sp.]
MVVVHAAPRDAAAPQSSGEANRADRAPLEPQAALASLVVEPGYRVDLVVAEPLVRSPVAIAFDDDQQLYVVENRGYPDPLEGQPAAPALGRIARLTDGDGDGRYDTRTEFATGLTYPNGIAIWDGGVFVTQAPDLLYLKDTDGDGVADVRRVVLTGFNATRTAQIRFSHPTLGPDGWLYLTSGLNGGRVVSPDYPDRPAVTFTSSDSRFHPVSGAFELTGGQGQYGLTFDDEGHRFICANRHPMWHVVLEPRHLQRNPHLAFSDTVQEVSTVGAAARVWPLSQDLTTASFMPSLMQAPHSGTFTAASGVHVHRGDGLPDGHRGGIFIAESAQNLVQRQVRSRLGVSFRSQPAREGAEFLASRDTWFRPVFLTGGPDGALYVVDMYRRDIDHPAYVPEDSRAQFDFTAGRERGRIYRVAATKLRPGRTDASLARASTSDLVGLLAHTDGWWRDGAQRRLLEGNRKDAVPALRALARSGHDLARLHAMWTLDALGALDDDALVAGMADQSIGVRENAVARASARLGSSPVLAAVLEASDDDDSRVRLQVALALGGTSDPRRIAALASIARTDGADRWARAAILSSLRDGAGAFLTALIEGGAMPVAVRAAVMQDLARLFGATESMEKCRALLSEIADPAGELRWQPAALSGLAAGLRTRRDLEATSGGSTLLGLTSGTTPAAREARTRLDLQFARAAALAAIDDAPEEQRLAAIDLLGQSTWATSGQALLRLLGPEVPAAVQMAAVRSLGQLRDAEAAGALVSRARWAGYSPRVRDAVVTTMLADEGRIGVLLDAVAAGAVPAPAVGVANWRRLTTHASPTVRDRSTRLSAGIGGESAQREYVRLKDTVLARTGNAARGATGFATYCAACHTSGGTGGTLGPDLSGVRNQPAEALLLHIVVPDHEITPGYETYTVQTRDGRTLSGRVASEAPNGLTLRDGAGESHAILRRDIVSMSAAPSSLMPAGLGSAIPPEQLADILAYLKRQRP